MEGSLPRRKVAGSKNTVILHQQVSLKLRMLETQGAEEIASASRNLYNRRQ
jgi:hypothetical protein